MNGGRQRPMGSTLAMNRRAIPLPLDRGNAYPVVLARSPPQR